MATPTGDLHDVFISYSPADQAWVRGELLPRLEAAGLRVLVDYRDFAIGTTTQANIEQAVERSRKTLLVLTPDWVSSEWNDFESLLAASADPTARRRKLLPLLLRPCTPPARIAMLTPADFTDPATQREEMRRLLRALGARARIFIS